MDETVLIHQAQRGDLNAFNRLVIEYQDMVYHQAYRVLGEADAADDATQDAILKAYKEINAYRGGSFRAWLLRIVTNTCYDELRRRKRRPTTPLEPVVAEEDDLIESPSWLADPSDGPEENSMRRELAEAIQHCLDDLPDDFRSVVVLVDVQGMDYDEASSVVGSPLGTVKSRLARARHKLRDCLQGFRELLPVSMRLGEEGT